MTGNDEAGPISINPGPDSHKTLVVIGVARSGTSLVAGCLHQLGVFMGDQALPPVYEDMALAAAVEAGDLATAAGIIRNYDQRHDCWGWKRPAALYHLPEIHRLLRSPRYIMVSRDLFAIANRNLLSMGSGVLHDMRRSIAEYSRLLDFVETHNVPLLLTPYAQVLRDKAAFLDTLCEFAALQPSEQAYERALEFITPAPDAYLKATRAGRTIGHLDAVEKDRISGWAARRGTHADSAPLSVRLSINGKPAAETLANQPRPDLIRHRVHPTGQAGFCFRLDCGMMLHPGDEVRVFAGDENEELNQSPWQYHSTQS